jgi:hypothetical protein
LLIKFNCNWHELVNNYLLMINQAHIIWVCYPCQVRYPLSKTHSENALSSKEYLFCLIFSYILEVKVDSGVFTFQASVDQKYLGLVSNNFLWSIVNSDWNQFYFLLNGFLRNILLENKFLLNLSSITMVASIGD